MLAKKTRGLLILRVRCTAGVQGDNVRRARPERISTMSTQAARLTTRAAPVDVLQEIVDSLDPPVL